MEEFYLYTLPFLFAAGAGALLWFGLPNLRQARLLARPLSLEQLKDHLDELVVVYGEPEPEEELHMRLLRSRRTPVLWHRIEKQERVGGSRNSHWRTVRKKEKRTNFHLRFPDGGAVYVRCRPTEVQNHGQRISGGGMTAGSHRTINTWLPVVRHLTVMGRLVHEKRGATIEPHPREGLFFSPSPPAAAARKERLKGWSMTGGAAACAVAALVSALLVFA